MRRALRTSALAALALLAGGCHFHRSVRDQPCAQGEPYLHAESVPPVRTADGLSAPNTRNALKIPDAPTALKPRMRSDGCLDQPPSFFPGRPKPGAKQPAQLPQPSQPPPPAAAARPVVPATPADGAQAPAAPPDPAPAAPPVPEPK